MRLPPNQPLIDQRVNPSAVGLSLAMLLFALVRVEAEPVNTPLPSFNPEQIQFFESQIRPLLSEYCWECHGAEQQKGGLLLSQRMSIIAGGESGPAVVPGDPEKSLLIEGIRYRNGDFQMPPSKKLKEREIKLFEQWVRMGAPWPGSGPNQRLNRNAMGQDFKMTAQDRNYWAFRPVVRPPVPESERAGFQSPIDHFIDEPLVKKQLKPLPRADRRTLIRRAYFDLLGLPPSFEEIEAFEEDSRPDAFRRLVDQLLAMPQYAERYGRHWLDVVRFAQTNGYERDDEKPLAWQYRDYVIGSFNSDKPYDQFVREQLAGDEFDHPTRDSLIATGFFRLGVWDDEPDDRRAAEFDGLDDMLKTTSETFMGLTIGCARCHHHMFDPISQQDYYELLAFFRNIRYYDRPRLAHDSATYLPLADPKEVHRWRSQLATLGTKATQVYQSLTEDLEAAIKRKKRSTLTDAQKVALSLPDSERTAEHMSLAREAEKRLQVKREEILEALPEKDRHSIEAAERKLKAFESNPPWGKDYALGVRENGATPPTTHVLIRGNAGRPGEEVAPRIPAVLETTETQTPSIHPFENSSGRRRFLADWMSSRQHPLTARGFVNRIWQHHFGRGLVATPNDFGKAGVPPTHPELLDWLAREFMDHQWSIKHLHRIIMHSQAYQRASTPDALNERIDPGNRFLWRQNLRRLEAEAIRDAILSTSGQLNETMGGRGFFPNLSSEVVAGGSRPGRGWGYSEARERNRRSVYTFIKRTMGVPLLEVFDYNNTEGSLGTRTTTTVAPQALTLLNDEFVAEQAGHLAKRLEARHGSNLSQIVQTAYRHTLSRDPTPSEESIALAFISDQLTKQTAIGGRLTFRPEVPQALERDFLKSLPDHRILVPPNSDWQSFRGRWGSEYESILVADASHGAFTLWKPALFREATVHGRLKTDASTQQVALLLRTRPYRDSRLGYEVCLDFDSGAIVIRRNQPDQTILKTFPATLDRGTWLSFKVVLTETTLTISGAGLTRPIVVSDPQPIPHSGYFGIRTLGGSTHFDQLTLQSGLWTAEVSNRISPEQKIPPVEEADLDQPAFDEHFLILEPDHHRARQAALRELCSILFNLNEFAYID